MQDNYIEFQWRHEPTTQSHRYIVPHILSMLRASAVPLNARILDAGCGGGGLVHALYMHGYHSLWGIDASESGIQLAQSHFPRIAERYCRHNVYTANLPIQLPSAYDVIISMEVIEHLYSPTQYIQNIYSWLNDKGYLLITTPYHGYLKNVAIAVAHQYDRHCNPLHEGGHIKFFSYKTLTALLLREGFAIEQFQGCGRMPFLWKSMILLARKR